MKPTAHQYEDKLLELAYGELPAPEASAVESHVRTCARCTEALSEIRAVRNTMGQLPMEPVPETGLESLYAYAEQAARRNAVGPAPVATWWRKLMAPLMAAGALSLIGIVAYQTTKDGPVVASREEIAQVAAKSELTAEPIAKESPPAAAAPVVAAAEPPPAPAEVWDQAAANNEEQVVAAKVAPKPQLDDAKKAEGAELGEGLYKGAKLSREAKNRKAADEVDNYADVGTRMKKSQAPAKAPAPAPRPAEENKVAAYDKSGKDLEAQQGYGINQPGNAGGANRRAPPQAEQAPPMAPPPPPLQAQLPSSDTGRTAGNFGLSSSGSSSNAMPQQSNRQVMGPESGSLAERDRDDRARGGKADAPAVAAAQKPQEMRASFDAQLKAARAAAASRATDEEVRILLSVLAHNAQGSQRLEALAGVCRGLQTLGQIDEATRYCQALVREFPDSPVARAWLDSQNRNIQRPAAKRSSKPQYDYSEDEARPASPAESQKAEPAATQAK